MTERDPRVDPVKGDVLGSTWMERTVKRVTEKPPLVLFTERVGQVPVRGMSHNDWATPGKWRRWAKTATIIRRAEEEPRK